MRLLDILHKPAELWSLGLERLKRSLGYGDKSRRLAECQATIDKLNARVELLTSELEKRTAELEKHKTATGNMWKFIHRRHRLDVDPEKGTIRNVLVATGRRVERKAKALLIIAATVLSVQSSYGQAIWRNYWTTNQNPQITPSLMATNSATNNQVIVATSPISAAWVSSLVELDVGDLVVSNPPYLNLANSTNSPPRYLGITIDGGGSAITTGTKGFIEVSHNCTITAATMLADQVGGCGINVWRTNANGFPPTAVGKISGDASPVLTSTNWSRDTTLTGWTTALSANDIIGFNVESNATITRVTLQLKVQQ